MTSLLEGAKRLVTRGTDIGARVAASRPPPPPPEDGSTTTSSTRPTTIVERAAGRLAPVRGAHRRRASPAPPGSGKSSTFNALTGLDLSSVGVRRPTTSWATACVWGQEGAEELLEWLGIAAPPPDDA